jgi:amidase
VPVSIKDAFSTRDMRTTSSFRPLADYRPVADASVVARWRQAGAILMGKSNLPELAGAPHCWSPLFGLTRNPWNPALTPGAARAAAPWPSRPASRCWRSAATLAARSASRRPTAALPG